MSSNLDEDSMMKDARIFTRLIKEGHTGKTKLLLKRIIKNWWTFEKWLRLRCEMSNWINGITQYNSTEHHNTNKMKKFQTS